MAPAPPSALDHRSSPNGVGVCAINHLAQLHRCLHRMRVRGVAVSAGCLNCESDAVLRQ
jgi:hypothetical protein